MNNCRSLVDRFVAQVENVIGQRSVLSRIARCSQKLLVDPLVETSPDQGKAISRKSSRAAINGPISGLRATQEIERNDVLNVQHPGQKGLEAIENTDFTGHRTDPPIAERAGQGQQGSRLDFAVRINGNNDLPCRRPEAGSQGFSLPAIFRELHRTDQSRMFPHGTLNVKPSIIDAAIIDNDDFHSIARVDGICTRINGLTDHGTFIVSWDDYSDFRRIIKIHIGCRSIIDP